MRAYSATLALLLGCVLASQAPARTLDAVRASGQIGLCAHPNSLPFASKKDDPPGFQVELGRALAAQLGVALTLDWVVVPPQVFRTDCDFILDAIDNREAQTENRLRLSKPYFGGGVALAVPKGSPITSFASLNAHTKVGVTVGAIVAMILDERNVGISFFGYEDDILAAIATHEIDAGAVSPMSAGYFNVLHPDQAVTILPPDPTAQDLSWNLSVGMRKPDDKLAAAVDAAIDHLTADGTIKAIYARYGIPAQAPH